MAKKAKEFKGYMFEDNGHGDLYSAEADKFLIFRPYPIMVDTVIHKDDSVTMNRAKFKENTDKNKGVYEEGYEENDDGSVFVKSEDVDSKIKEESEDNKSTQYQQEKFQVSEKQVRAMQLYDDGDIDYDELVNDYFEGDFEDAGQALYEFGSERAEKEDKATRESLGMNPNENYVDKSGETPKEERNYRFDFGFKDGAALREDAFEDAKAYLEEEDMAQYLDEPLKSKIDSMKWVLDSTDAVHVDINSNQRLTDEDMAALKDFIEGQNSDGLGEGFEQQDFAEGYYDPDTGEGPYTYQEVMDIVSRNFDNMELDDYVDEIDHEDIREALESYVRDGNYNYSFEDYLRDNIEGIETEEDREEFERELENTPEEELFSQYSDEYEDWLDDEEDDFINSGYLEEYLSPEAIDNAKDTVAQNDPRYNENLWDGGMTSMEWNIQPGKDITPEPEPDNLPSKNYSDYNGLMLADQDEYGDYFFNKSDDMKKLGESIVNDLNNNKFDSDSEYKFRLANDGRNLEIYDSSEAQGSQDNPDFDKLEKELKKQLGDNIYLEPYDSVSVYVAGIYGNEVPEENVRRDNDDSYEESQKTSNLSDSDLGAIDMVKDALSDNLGADWRNKSLVDIEDIVHDTVYKYNEANVQPEYENEDFYGNEANANEIYKYILDNEIPENNKRTNTLDNSISSFEGTKEEIMRKHPELRDNPNYKSYDKDDYMAVDYNEDGSIKGLRLTTRPYSIDKLNQEISDDFDRNYPERSKEIENNFNNSLKQAAAELGYNVNTNDAKQWRDIRERAEEIRNNQNLKESYSRVSRNETIYKSIDDAYAAYQNGEISFEEYQERLKKIKRN